MQRPRERTEEKTDGTRRWERPLIGNVKSGIYHTPDHKNYGDVHPKNQVHFWTELAAREAGYRRAKNDQYGRGSGHAMTAKETAQGRSKSQRSRAPQRPALHGHGLVALLERAKRVIEADSAGGSLRVKLYHEKEHEHGVGW